MWRERGMLVFPVWTGFILVIWNDSWWNNYSCSLVSRLPACLCRYATNKIGEWSQISPLEMMQLIIHQIGRVMVQFESPAELTCSFALFVIRCLITRCRPMCHFLSKMTKWGQKQESVLLHQSHCWPLALLCSSGSCIKYVTCLLK